MSMILGVLMACAAGLAGTLLCPPAADSRGRRDLALAGAALLTGALAGPLPPARAGELLAGPARVVDGGTLVVGERRVRLHAIAAPAPDQVCWDAREQAYPCGRAAARALADRIGGAAVTCEPRGAPQDGAVAALCRVGGEDLAAWMVGEGYALAGRQDAAAYAEVGARAWGRRRGLWAGVFEDPDAWRRLHGPRAVVARSAGS